MKNILKDERAEYLIFNLSNLDLSEIKYSKVNIYQNSSKSEIEVNEIIEIFNKHKIIHENTFIITDSEVLLSNELLQSFFKDSNIIAVNITIPEGFNSFLNLQIGEFNQALNLNACIKFCGGDKINSVIETYLAYLINDMMPKLILEHKFQINDNGNIITDEQIGNITELELISLNKSYSWLVNGDSININELVDSLDLSGQYSIFINQYEQQEKTAYRLSKDLIFNDNQNEIVSKQEYFKLDLLKSTKYLNIESFSFESSNKNVFLKSDGSEMYYGSSRNRHTYLYNIKNNFKTIKLSSNTRHLISFSDEMQVNRTQKQYNLKVKLQNYNSVNYSEMTLGKPKKLLLTFPGFNTSSNVHYPVSLLKSMHKKLDDIAIIATQDFSEVLGTYMSYNQYGEEFEQKLIEFIKYKLEEFDLEEKDLILYGNSKGGTIALRFSKLFREARVIADAPQLDLKAKTLNDLVINSFDKYVYENNYLIDYIKEDNPNVYYAFSLVDTDSNCKIEAKELGCNYVMYESESHGHVIRKNLPLAIDLIIGNDLKHRTYKWDAQKIEYAINCKYDFVYKLNTEKKWIAKAIYDFNDISNGDNLIIAKAHNIFYIKADLTPKLKEVNNDDIIKETSSVDSTKIQDSKLEDTKPTSVPLEKTNENPVDERKNKSFINKIFKAFLK